MKIKNIGQNKHLVAGKKAGEVIHLSVGEVKDVPDAIAEKLLAIYPESFTQAPAPKITVDKK